MPPKPPPSDWSDFNPKSPKRPVPKWAGGGSLLWHYGWTGAFALNLVVPIMIAREMVQERGLVGMVLGIGLLWLAGDLLGVRFPRQGPPLLVGGIVVAISQFYPLLQIFAGMLGVGLATRLLGEGDGTSLSWILSGPAAFLSTLFTGGALMSAAWCGGWIVLGIVRFLK